MKMCEALAVLGFAVELICPDVEQGAEKEVGDVFGFYGVRKNFFIIKVPQPSVKGARYIYGMLAAVRAWLAKPDIVYGRNLFGCFFSTLLGLNVVFESHAPLDESDRVVKGMFRWMLDKISFLKLVVITHSLKNYYLTRYPNSERVVMVAPDAASPVPSGLAAINLGDGGARLLVGYVGQLYKGKGVEIIVRLAPLCPQADFHVVGGYDVDIKYWKERCNGIGNIFFHGFVPHRRAYDYICAMDVILLPNQDFVSGHGNGINNISKWTSPLKAFEYMAAGKAIVASDLPVLREVFRDGENAVLCSSSDVNEWRVAVERLLQDDRLRQRLGHCALEDFLSMYSWEARAKRIIGELS